MIRIGAGVMDLGVMMIVLPLENAYLSGLPVFGLGCAPVYPFVIHATPDHFGQRTARESPASRWPAPAPAPP